MADKQKKKTSEKKTGRKSQPKKQSVLLKPATILLITLTVLLLILGLLYLSRHQHRFANSETANDKSSVVISVKNDETSRSSSEISQQHVEEYREVPRKDSAHPVIIESEGPLMAIIIDDLGGDIDLLHDFLRLDLNVTAAVLPNLPHARQAAELAHNKGREVILHIPMEPKNFPQSDPGPDALLTRLSKVEIQERLLRQLEKVPWIVGANNHMGSRFTESQGGMQGVLEILHEKNLFFVDSRTTGLSVAESEASKLKVKSAERDIFLDNRLAVDDIRQQLRKLMALAKEQGSAIGICHPHKETLAALRMEVPAIAASGIRMVPVSMLVH